MSKMSNIYQSPNANNSTYCVVGTLVRKNNKPNIKSYTLHKKPINPKHSTDSLTRELQCEANKLESLCTFPYAKQINIDKLEISISLKFGISDMSLEDIHSKLEKLATHMSSSSRYPSEDRSVLLGAAQDDGYRENTRTDFLAKEYNKEMSYKFTIYPRSTPLKDPKQVLLLPGKYSSLNVLPKSQSIPVPLHTVTKVLMTYQEDTISSITNKPIQKHIIIKYSMNLNIQRALHHHPFLSNKNITDNQLCASFFPNPTINLPKDKDNLPSLTHNQIDITNALYNIFNGQMNMLYEDLRRASTYTDIINPKDSWQEALHHIVINSIEINRHIITENAYTTLPLLRAAFNFARRNLICREHDNGTERGHALDDTNISLHSTIRRKNNKAIVSVCLYAKTDKLIRIELRLKQQPGLFKDVPKTWDDRSTSSNTLEHFISKILSITIHSQKTLFDMTYDMNRIPLIHPRDIHHFIGKLRNDTPYKYQKSMETVIDRLYTNPILDSKQGYTKEELKYLRNMSRKGYFHKKGAQNTPYYIPCIQRL